jgi:hypothetical protein
MALEWWVKDFRIFVPVRERKGASDVVEKRLPLSLRNALQRYAQELARKVRSSATRNCAKEQVDRKRGSRRKGRSSAAPGLMDVLLAGRCLTK